MRNAVKKRSVAIGGRRTSISLEDEFWIALNMVAIARGLSLSEFVTRIRQEATTANLSSNIRIALLTYYRELAQGVTPQSAAALESGAQIVPFRRLRRVVRAAVSPSPRADEA